MRVPDPCSGEGKTRIETAVCDTHEGVTGLSLYVVYVVLVFLLRLFENCNCIQVRPGITAFEDIIRGHMEVSDRDIDDQVLLKSDGFPTYHLANVLET